MVRNVVSCGHVGGLLPIASETTNGLMPRNSFFNLGTLWGNDLKNIPDGYGYTDNSDGSGIGGIFSQISGYEAKFQIKIAYDGTEILKRVKKNIGDKEWTQRSAL